MLANEGRRVEVIFPGETTDDLVDDFVSVITSMAARIYGRCSTKRRTAQIKACIEKQMEEEEA